jgi:hypothetical protein
VKRLTILVLAILLVPVVGQAQQDDPCAFQGTVQEFFASARLVDALTIKTKSKTDALTNEAKNETKAEMASRTNDDGLAGGRLDLLRRAFVGLNLGEVTNEKGGIVFNFNPKLLDFDTLGQFSPRVVVHQATLFAPLDEKIGTLSESERQNAKDTLSKDLGDFDDVEFRLRWTPLISTPGQELQAVATEIFMPVYRSTIQTEAQGVASDVADLTASIRAAGLDPAKVPVAELCKQQVPHDQLLALVERLETKTAKALDNLHTKLTDQFFFALADLIEGQPKLVGEAAFHRREGAAGPNEGTASLRLEVGPRSYWGWKRWAKNNGKALDAGSAQEYLKGFQDTLPLLSLTVDYTHTSDFEIPLPGGTEAFSQGGGRKVSANLQGGIYLGTSRAHRLSLEAKYDWASGGGQNRFVSTLTWTEKPDAALGEAVKQLTGGSDIVISLVWANKPEFRGDVNHDLGMRAGLKWSFGGTKE